MLKRIEPFPQLLARAGDGVATLCIGGGQGMAASVEVRG